MTLAQLLPQAKFVDRHHAAAGGPDGRPPRAPRWRPSSTSRSLGVIENMSGFTTPDGERFTIFGEGGGQLLADELDVPLLGKVPLDEPLREHADTGMPLVIAEPDDPAAQAIRQAARGLIALTPAGAAGPAGAGAGRGAQAGRHVAADGLKRSGRAADAAACGRRTGACAAP